MNPNLKGHLPSLLFTSGLIHDLGNPPYGHFGEVAIQEFFKTYFENNSSTLNEQEKADFVNFDGNVQTFRILRKLSFLGHEYSYNLTFPTLATIIKYPCDSLTGNKKSDTDDINLKKFGYFSTETDDYHKISEALGLNGCRHPATFLLEAADDIAYSAADIEDGMKLKSLNYEIVYEVFDKIAANGGEPDKKIFETLKRYKSVAETMPDVGNGYLVSKFRIDTQVEMIQSVINQFIKVHDDILAGEYRRELLKDSPARRIRQGFKDLSKVVFADPNVMQAEIAGYEVISGLLDNFVKASKSDDFRADGEGLEGRYYRMISSSLRYIHEKYPSEKNREYRNLQLIVDFISGMTDSYALNYYKKLTGVSY